MDLYIQLRDRLELVKCNIGYEFIGTFHPARARGARAFHFMCCICNEGPIVASCFLKAHLAVASSDLIPVTQDTA